MESMTRGKYSGIPLPGGRMSNIPDAFIRNGGNADFLGDLPEGHGERGIEFF
jgi:hypothetical protein